MRGKGSASQYDQRRDKQAGESRHTDITAHDLPVRNCWPAVYCGVSERAGCIWRGDRSRLWAGAAGATSAAEIFDGPGESGVEGGGVGFTESFTQAVFGCAAGLLDSRFIDFVGADCHVSEDGYVIACDLGESGADCEVVIFAAAFDDDFAGHDFCHQGCMQRVNAQLAFHARERDHFGLFGTDNSFRGDDFEFEGIGHRAPAMLAFVDFLDRAFHVEVALGDIIVFAFEDFLESFDGVSHRDLFAGSSGEHFSD